MNESEELYNFHEAVSLLIETEEQLIDQHKTSVEVGSLFAPIQIDDSAKDDGPPFAQCMMGITPSNA